MYPLEHIPDCSASSAVKGAEQTMNFHISTSQPNEHLLAKLHCPLCASATTMPFLRRSGVPVLTNLLMVSIATKNSPKVLR